MPIEVSSAEEALDRVLRSNSGVFVHSAAATPTKLVQAMAAGA